MILTSQKENPKHECPPGGKFEARNPKSETKPKNRKS